MVTKNVNIGTVSKLIVSCDRDQIIDFLVQNLSANSLYIGDDDVSASNGMKIAANGGNYSNDKRKSPIFLIADGDPSDIRITYEIYKEGSR